MGILYSLEDFYALAGGQGNYGFLPAGAVTLIAGALAAYLAVDVERVHSNHGYLEGLFHGLFDLHLVRVGRYFEGVATLLHQFGIALGHERANEHVMKVRH